MRKLVKLTVAPSRLHKKWQRFIRRYGMSPEEYKERFEAQKGVCALCFEAETTKRRGTSCRMVIDHDHVTGKIRGLLCWRCNTAIAGGRDTLEWIERLLEYVTK